MKMQFTCPGCGGHYLIRTIEERVEYLCSELMQTDDGLQPADTPPWGSSGPKLLSVRCAECGRSWPSLEQMQEDGCIAPHPMNGKRRLSCTVYGTDGSAQPVNLILDTDRELTPDDLARIKARVLGSGVPGLVICPELLSTIGPVDIALN